MAMILKWFLGPVGRYVGMALLAAFVLQGTLDSRYKAFAAYATVREIADTFGKDGVESIYCKPGMVGTVKIVGRSVWFRADGEETDFCATDWLEHA